MLGNKVGGLWVVRRVLPSCPESVRTPHHFSMDSQHVNSQVQAVLRNNPTYQVLGLWHKHNHNYSPLFSADDMITNYAYAQINTFGAISILAVKAESEYILHSFYFDRGKCYRGEAMIGKTTIQM